MVCVCVFLSCSEFIDPSARTMVNLSAEAFEEAQKDLQQPSRYSFSLAQVQYAGVQRNVWKEVKHAILHYCGFFNCILQTQVFSLMNCDIYPRFLKSEEYLSLVKMLPGGGSVGKRYMYMYGLLMTC